MLAPPSAPSTGFPHSGHRSISTISLGIMASPLGPPRPSATDMVRRVNLSADPADARPSRVMEIGCPNIAPRALHHQAQLREESRAKWAGPCLTKPYRRKALPPPGRTRSAGQTGDSRPGEGGGPGYPLPSTEGGHMPSGHLMSAVMPTHDRPDQSDRATEPVPGPNRGEPVVEQPASLDATSETENSSGSSGAGQGRRDAR
jgi:hypothetical protein